MSILYEELNMFLHAFQVQCFYMVIILLHTSISNEVLYKITIFIPSALLYAFQNN